MAILQQYRAKFIPAWAVAVSACFVLSGCGGEEEALPEEPIVEQEVVTIGGSLPSPGLITGIDPADVTGAEVDLAAALAPYLDPDEPESQVQWFPLPADGGREALLAGQLDLVIGQLQDKQLTDEHGWVGPYLTVEGALLVRSATASTESAQDEGQTPGLSVVQTLEELADASICVVAGSVAHEQDVPAAVVTVQQSVTECEIGMRSGRFDAIAADDVQLAGMLLDSLTPPVYELLYWSDVLPADTQTDDDSQPGDDDAVVVDEELLESRQYWIGVTGQRCDHFVEGLQTVLDDGTAQEAFAGFDEVPGFQLHLAAPAEVTTLHCDS